MKINYSTEDGYSSADLLNYAHCHLASAKVLFDHSPSCYDSAGHLGHLGIELILKALLLHSSSTNSFPNEHNLLKLLSDIESVEDIPRLKAKPRETLVQINQFSLIRYPTPKNPVEIGDEDWAKIEELVNALFSILPTELQHELLEPEINIKGERILLWKKRTNGM